MVMYFLYYLYSAPCFCCHFTGENLIKAVVSKSGEKDANVEEVKTNDETPLEISVNNVSGQLDKPQREILASEAQEEKGEGGEKSREQESDGNKQENNDAARKGGKGLKCSQRYMECAHFDL